MKLLDSLMEYQELFANGSGNTAKAKRTDLRHLFAFATIKIGPNPEAVKLTPERCKQFVSWCLDERKEKPATVNRRIATLKHFCSWQRECKGLMNAAFGLKNIDFEPTDPKWFTPEEEAAFSSIELPPTLAMIVALQEYQGLRISDVLDLRVGQCNIDSAFCDLQLRKRHSLARKHLHTLTVDRFRVYLPFRENQLTTHDKHFAGYDYELKQEYPLIVSTHGAKHGKPESYKVNPRTVNGWLYKLQDAIGVKLHTHRFRHNAGHHRRHLDLRMLADFMDHKSVETTRRMYVKNTNEENKEAVNGYK